MLFFLFFEASWKSQTLKVEPKRRKSVQTRLCPFSLKDDVFFTNIHRKRINSVFVLLLEARVSNGFRGFVVHPEVKPSKLGAPMLSWFSQHNLNAHASWTICERPMRGRYPP